MTAFPAAAYMNNNARTEGEMKTALENFLAATKQLPGAAADSELTISSGAVTPTGARHTVDTESDAATDTLSNVVTTNLPDGSLLRLSANNAGRTVVVEHQAGGAGQISTRDGQDYSMTTTGHWILLERDGADWTEVDRAPPIRPTAIAGDAKALIIKVNATNPTYQVDVSADDLVVKDGIGGADLLAGVSLTVDITASGANGLDTGTEASSTWYFVWTIWDGSTTAGLLSTSATAPTLPTGYTHKALVGAVRNDGSSDFEAFFQRGRKVACTAQLASSAEPAASDTWESLSISAVVPAIAVAISGTIGGRFQFDNEVAIAADANGLGAVYHVANDDGESYNNFNTGSPFNVLLTVAQTTYWKSATTSDEMRIEITGWEW